MQRTQPDDRSRHTGLRQNPLTRKAEKEDTQPLIYSRTNASRRSFRRTGLPSGVVSDRSHERRLARGAAATLGTGALAAQIGVVDLHPPTEPLAGVAFHHH